MTFAKLARTGLWKSAVLAGLIMTAPVMGLAKDKPPAPKTFAGLPEAQEEYDKLFLKLKTCINKPTRAERIFCYDEASMSVGLVPENFVQAERREIGKFGFWEGTRVVDDFGQVTYYYKLSPDVQPVRASKYSQPEIVVLCSHHKTQFYLDWKAALQSIQSQPKKIYVEYKTGLENKVEEWDLSMDKFAAFTPDPISFLKYLKDKQKLVLVFPTASEGVKSLLFTLDGLPSVLDSVVENCYPA